MPGGRFPLASNSGKGISLPPRRHYTTERRLPRLTKADDKPGRSAFRDAWISVGPARTFAPPIPDLNTGDQGAEQAAQVSSLVPPTHRLEAPLVFDLGTRQWIICALQ